MSLRMPLLLYVVVNVLEYLASGPENQDRLPLLQKFHFLSVGISSVGEFSLLQFSSQDQDGSPSATQAFFPEHADQCAPASHSPGRFLVIRNEAGFIFNPLCPARMLPSPLTHWITFSSNKYSIYEACCRWTSHARLLLPWTWCPVDPRNTRRWLPRGNLLVLEKAPWRARLHKTASSKDSHASPLGPFFSQMNGVLSFRHLLPTCRKYAQNELHAGVERVHLRKFSGDRGDDSLCRDSCHPCVWNDLY